MKSKNEVNRERFADEKKPPMRTAKDKRASVNQRVRKLNPEDFETEEFETFEKFHRSR